MFHTIIFDVFQEHKIPKIVTEEKGLINRSHSFDGELFFCIISLFFQLLKKGTKLLQINKVNSCCQKNNGRFPLVLGDKMLADTIPSSHSSRVLLEMGEFLQLVSHLSLLL